MRSWITLLLITVLIFLFTGGCSEQEALFMDEFWEQDYDNVSAVYIRCGKSGGLREVESEEKIEELLKTLAQVEVTRSPDQQLRSGYIYYIDIYYNEAEPVRLTFLGDMLNHDGVYYDLKTPLDKNILDSFYSY